MRKGYTEIVVVLDRSGSMHSIKVSTIEGFNAFLAEQKKAPGEATLTLAQFDDRYEVVYNGVDIRNVEPLTEKTFQPRGGTALYDAVCRTIDSVGKNLHNLRERDKPEKVIFVIITDGEENSSSHFSYVDVNSKISHQRDNYNWEFVFLAANQDAMAVGQSFGIPRANAMIYTASVVGTESVFDNLSKNVVMYRSNVKSDMSYTAQDRAVQDEANKA